MVAFGLQKIIDKFEEMGSFNLKCDRETIAIVRSEWRMWLQYCRKCEFVLCERAAHMEFPVRSTCLSANLVKIYETSCYSVHTQSHLFKSCFLLIYQNEKRRMENETCSNGSLQCVALEHFVDRRSPFSSPSPQGPVNAQSCRIWASENPFQMGTLSLHSAKVTVWCEFVATFIVDPFFFEEIRSSGSVSYTDNKTCRESFSCNPFIPALQ